MKGNKKKLIIGITSATLAVLLVASLITVYAVSVTIYDASFNYRFETNEENSFELSDFPTLTRSEKHTFKSNNGQTLVGYLYEQCIPVKPENDENASTDAEQIAPAEAEQILPLEKKGVVIFAHGFGGGGQRGYMDIFNYLCSRGYYVFAYDATANDESEGEVVGGLPQGVIDLDYAIDYAKALDELKDLPIMLMGYSWGGMSVVNVLNFQPDVTAVASLAGWDKSMNMIEHEGKEMVGGVATLMLPFASVYEYTKYGTYSFSTAMKGFENSDCAVMIVHGEKDTTIPIAYGYDTYFEKYGDDDRFTFKKYEDRDHDVMKTADDKLDLELMAEVADFFDASIKADTTDK